MAHSIYSKPLEIVADHGETIRLRIPGGVEFEVPAAIFPQEVDVKKVILDCVAQNQANDLVGRRHQRLQEMIN